MTEIEIDPETGLILPNYGAPSPETGAVVEPLAGHTAKGYPYALPGDALTDWPATSLELANLLDSKDVIPWTSAVGIIAPNFLQRADYPAFYSKDRAGVVRFRGLVAWQQGVTLANQPMLNLPAALRPPAVEYLQTWTQAGPASAVNNVSYLTISQIQHDPGGGYTGFWVSLSPVSWVAA